MIRNIFVNLAVILAILGIGHLFTHSEAYAKEDEKAQMSVPDESTDPAAQSVASTDPKYGQGAAAAPSSTDGQCKIKADGTDAPARVEDKTAPKKAPVAKATNVK